MRFLMRISWDVEAGNAIIRSGKLGQVVQSILAEQKPEAHGIGALFVSERDLIRALYLRPQHLAGRRAALARWLTRPDHPLMDSKERKLAHSDRFVFPRITAPPARRFAATVESVSAGLPTSANEPAVVCIISPVSTLSLSNTGIPCKGPSIMPCLRNWSAWRAISSASGFSSITELTPGPFWSSAIMRAMYSLVSSTEVSLPEAISAWSWATVASLCVFGTSDDSLFRVASFAAAKGSASKAERRRVRRAGTIIWVLLGISVRAMP